jgi:hypothetical protein
LISNDLSFSITCLVSAPQGTGAVGVLFLIIIVGTIIWLVKKGIQQRALHQAAHEAFNAEHAGWDIYIAPFGDTVIAINHDSRAVVLGTVQSHKQYRWAAIAAVDVIRDGTIVTSTNRGSQIMGAAVGEILLGPLGLLIGGVTGSKLTVNRVSQIALKIIVDDRYTPIYTIEFLKVPGSGVDPRHKLVKDAASRAEHVHALLLNAIRNSSIPVSSPALQISERSTGDRIDQLWKLKEAGALTQAEFDQQNAQLLAGLQTQPGVVTNG